MSFIHARGLHSKSILGLYNRTRLIPITTMDCNGRTWFYSCREFSPQGTEEPVEDPEPSRTTVTHEYNHDDEDI